MRTSVTEVKHLQLEQTHVPADVDEVKQVRNDTGQALASVIVVA